MASSTRQGQREERDFSPTVGEGPEEAGMLHQLIVAVPEQIEHLVIR